MTSIYIRLVIILGVLWAGISALTPTYEWYFKLTQEQKSIADTSKKDMQALTQSIEDDARIIRQALGDPENYKIALSQKDQKNGIFALDIDPNTKIYTTQLNYPDLKNIIISQTNPQFKDFSTLEKAYQDIQVKNLQFQAVMDLQHLKNKVIKLGLDIAGGVHFSLAIDEEKMIQILNEQYAKLIDKEAISLEIRNKNPKISNSDLSKQIEEKIKLLTKEKQEKLQMQKDQGIDQALLKIRNRVDQFGVSEPIILKGPDNTIIVELAGEKDTESAKDIFTRVGVLSFQIINEEVMKDTPLDKRSLSGYIIDKNYISSHPSLNSTFLPVQGTDKFGQPIDEGYMSVFNRVDLTGDHITNATVDTNQLGQRTIGFRLDSRGADIFANITKQNVGKRLAIVLDGKIQSAPNIREAIMGGSGSISGTFSLKEANLLATILRSGSLPVPLKIEEERVIGPSLGQEEVHKGINAVLIALCFIMVFMFIYYGFWGGLSTNLSQIMNILFILSIMAQLGATLTLPGIAAIVLTIGMSVDANIIIHERIKEDIKAGYSLSSALVSGYHNALTTIIDSNITTFIPGLILGSMGDGPIRGFGVTLMIGLIVNIFTAVFCTRVFYDLIIEKWNIRNIFWGQLWNK